MDNEHNIEMSYTKSVFKDKRWDHILSQNVVPHMHFTTITQSMTSKPHELLTTRSLRDLFPVLENATVVESDHGFVLNKVHTTHYRLEGMLAFDTLHHGRVYVVCATLYDRIRNPCSMHLGIDLGNIEKRDLPATDDRSKGDLVFMLCNTGTPDKTNQILLTILVPLKGCRICNVVQGKMLKCGCCWNEVQFPVRYCSKQCQIADFPGHKGHCGRKLMTKTEGFSADNTPVGYGIICDWVGTSRSASSRFVYAIVAIGAIVVSGMVTVIMNCM